MKFNKLTCTHPDKQLPGIHIIERRKYKQAKHEMVGSF